MNGSAADAADEGNKLILILCSVRLPRGYVGSLAGHSFPEDKPLESLLDILKLGFRGYRHLAELARRR